MDRAPSTPREAALAVLQSLRDAGHTAYLAGGCVRDQLLGYEPKDFDVATDARPERVQRLFPRTRAVGVSFGVVLVQTGRHATEVATFRRDGVYSDKRRPDAVHFALPEDDARRRDFTINALFLDPLDRAQGDPGRVIDFVGGVADLKSRLLRAVGDPNARLAEDHLRALRAVRFAARYGFAIEPQTAAAIAAHARDLAGVSRERIGDEVRRMLQHPSRAAAAALLAELTLDAALGVRPSRPHPIPASGHPCLAALAETVPYPTALAAWAIDLGWDPAAAGTRSELVPRWRTALCLTNDERDALAATLRDLELLLNRWQAIPVAPAKRAAASPGFAEARRLLGILRPPLEAGVAARMTELAAIGGGIQPGPFVDGDRLIRLGLRPGPDFGRILAAVYDAQLEGRVADPASAEQLARELAGLPGVE